MTANDVVLKLIDTEIERGRYVDAAEIAAHYFRRGRADSERRKLITRIFDAAVEAGETRAARQISSRFGDDLPSGPFADFIEHVSPDSPDIINPRAPRRSDFDDEPTLTGEALAVVSNRQ